MTLIKQGKAPVRERRGGKERTRRLTGVIDAVAITP